MIRYAIYTRQSVEKLADFSSCEAQFHTCQDFAQATGEPNLHWCGRRFDDEGQSGATLDRPAMDRLRKVIDLGGIDRVYAVAAELGHVTRARITQIMNLLHLVPAIQEEILFLPRVTEGRDPVAERHVRPITAALDWQRQRGMWKKLLSGESHNAFNDNPPSHAFGST